MSHSISIQIKDSLIRLTSSMNTADSGAMLQAMEELDALVARHGREMDSRLHHFLERRSYAKALDYLAGSSDIPAGTCAPPRPPAS